MDFGKAALLMALVFVVIAYLKLLVPNTDPRIVQTLVFLGGIASVFLMGATVWAHTQVIGDHALDTLNTGSKIVAGLFVGAGSTVGAKIIDAVRNIGQNQGPDPTI